MADLPQIPSIRQRLSNLDLQNSKDLASYQDIRRKLLIGGEGCTHKAAPDIHGHLTVGYGFNMDRKEAAAEFKKAFKNSQNPPDFNRVLARKDVLSDSQINQLFDHSLEMREGELKNHYGKETWKTMQPSVRLGLEDIYYNTPSIIVRGTEFHKHLLEYHTSKTPEALNNAMACVCKNAEGQAAGVINRRHAQVGLLNVLDNPDYDGFTELHSKSAPKKAAQENKPAEHAAREAKHPPVHKETPHAKPKAHGAAPSKTEPVKHPKTKPAGKQDTHKTIKKKMVAMIDIGEERENLSALGVVHTPQTITPPATQENLHIAAIDAAKQMHGFLLNGDSGASIPYTRSNGPEGRTT